MGKAFEKATCRRYAKVEASTGDVLKAAGLLGGQRAWGLVQTPRKACFVSLDGGLALGEDGKPFPLDEAFELRLFSEHVEIAWRRNGATGRAVLTRDDETAPPADWKPVDAVPDYHHPSTRLLWGLEKTTTQSGWTVLATPRIGSLAVPPFEDEDKGEDHLHDGRRRIVVKVVEYARSADDGNVVPAGERLKGFGWLKPPAKQNAGQE